MRDGLLIPSFYMDKGLDRWLDPATRDWMARQQPRR